MEYFFPSFGDILTFAIKLPWNQFSRGFAKQNTIKPESQETRKIFSLRQVDLYRAFFSTESLKNPL